MKRSGYVLDLSVVPTKNLFLEEATRAELRVLSPVLLAVTETRLWLDRLRVKDISNEEIHSMWTEFLKENYSLA